MMTELFSWRELDQDELYTLVNRLSMILTEEFGQNSETCIQCREMFLDLLNKNKYLKK
ncbi:MAG: hypothetical protein LBT10_06840 [Methanobrevibacter sp.]|jgi:hypothetical protein|nr:hypothetical protein [Methanobrevibacter sp.]